jgi:hypothetical protein
MPFIKNNDPIWTNLLRETTHDIYHLPGYCRIEAQLIRGEALAWYSDNHQTQTLIPLISRKIQGLENYNDLVSPYGYPGILTQTPIDAAAAADILCAFNTEAAANNYVSSFIRLNPILNQWKFEEEMPWRQWLHGNTVSINLCDTLDEIRRHFSLNHCRNLKRLQQSGYNATVGDWTSIDEFIAAYRQTMTRRKAHPYYFFPETYFSALENLLKEKMIYIAVHNNENEFVAGGIFTHFGDVMQYHLGATTSKAVRYSPSKMMMDKAIQHGKAAGAETLHLGGGLGASISDGLFRFKKGFGTTLHTFSSLRFVHLPEHYTELSNRTRYFEESIDYFPEYRSNSNIYESNTEED